VGTPRGLVGPLAPIMILTLLIGNGIDFAAKIFFGTVHISIYQIVEPLFHLKTIVTKNSLLFLNGLVAELARFIFHVVFSRFLVSLYDHYRPTPVFPLTLILSSF
jgi:hypothetical protein